MAELEDYAIEMNKRIRVLRSLHVEELDGKVAAWLRQLKEMFPQVPDKILARVVPYKPGGDGRDVPWNRRLRRSLERSPSIIVHMFSGPDQKFWHQQLNSSHCKVLCVDTAINS